MSVRHTRTANSGYAQRTSFARAKYNKEIHHLDNRFWKIEYQVNLKVYQILTEDDILIGLVKLREIAEEYVNTHNVELLLGLPKTITHKNLPPGNQGKRTS